MLEKIHTITSAPPETPHEKTFQKLYREWHSVRHGAGTGFQYATPAFLLLSRSLTLPCVFLALQYTAGVFYVGRKGRNRCFISHICTCMSHTLVGRVFDEYLYTLWG